MKKRNIFTKSIVKSALVCFSITSGLLFTACSKESVVETIDIIEEGVETEATLDNLNGEWIRIASNNPVADGILIDMSGTSGTITDKAGSGFEVGDLKWKNIKAVDAENFTHEELGSDNAYYQATMLLKSDDTLRISVGSSGAGNAQKWVREGQYIPIDSQGPSATETLPCAISEARTLKNGTAAIDYFVDCVLDITAPLTIEPGTVVQFGENAGLGIYDGGSLNAIGTLIAPIVFEGKTAIEGFWRGVHIETKSINNQLENVRIQDAGSNYVYCCNGKASLFLKGAKIALTNIEIANGGNIGLMAIGEGEFTSYSNIRIETHKDYPVHIEPNLLSNFDGIDSDYSGNEKDFVFVVAGNIDQPTTWNQLNVPYLVEGKVIDVTEALTLEAGAQVIFQENGGLGVYDEGSLTVKGTDSNPVVMRGANALPGFWRGIHIETTSIENSLNYLQVSDAGSNYVYCCNEIGSLFLKSGTASVTNSTFSNGKSYGIVTRPGFEFNAYSGNTITTHQQAAMYISALIMGELDGLKSSYTGNEKDYLLVYNSDINEDITVLPNNVPFRIENAAVIDITARINLLAGVEIVFEEAAGLGVYDNGVFNAIGEASNRIVLRGAQNAVGFWRGIHTETNSIDNVIRYAEINNGGSNYVYCCNDPSSVFVKAGQLTVTDSNISDSGGCGIYVSARATFTESNNNYANNQGGNLCE